jgi:hypothetical protein
MGSGVVLCWTVVFGIAMKVDVTICSLLVIVKVQCLVDV